MRFGQIWLGVQFRNPDTILQSGDPEGYFWYSTFRAYFQFRIHFEIPNRELRKIGKYRIPKNLLATPASRINFSPYKHLGFPSQVNSVKSRRDNHQIMRKSC